MNKVKAENLLQAGLDYKADFVEIYEEENRHAALSFRDEKVESATVGISYGIGIRLIYGTEVLYVHSSNDEFDHLRKLIETLALTRGSEKMNGLELSKSLVRNNIENNHHIVQDPDKIGQESKVEILQFANKTARSFSDKICQSAITASDSIKNIEIFNSDGLWVADKRIRARFTISVTAEQKGERFSAHETPGALQGFEFFEKLNVRELAETAAERAVLMLNAGYIEAKKMPVIMGNGFGGVIFHEACGHQLETEAIRKKASPFAGKLGSKIAHEVVTAVDDGTIENSWGSLNVDDEGRKTEKTILIENGILKSYMSDRVGGEETGSRLTGSARRESYKYAPVSRMRNTFIERGKNTMDEMLAGVNYGLYAKKMGGGSVNPATGEFNFAVEEGYIIKNGKIGKAVRGATLIGRGEEILPEISMVGADLKLAAGMCGASSGMVPVTVGQPTLKVDEILVGGR